MCVDEAGCYRLTGCNDLSHGCERAKLSNCGYAVTGYCQVSFETGCASTVENRSIAYDDVKLWCHGALP
jgi:hypothetical protein